MNAPAIDHLLDIMAQLRAPNGCPWDQVQTHQSLLPNMIEEAYEAVDALQSGNKDHIKEELGDVLLQVIFHAQIAQEKGDFTFNDIVQELSDKLIRRHPHVFGEAIAETPNQVISTWKAVKKSEKGLSDKPYLSGTGNGLPQLLKAVKLQKKAGKVHFDWPDSEAVIEKIREELDEVIDTKVQKESKDRLEEELGDLLFAVANLCRKESIDPEIALSKANSKFERRFGKIESALSQTDTPIGKADLETMDALWNQIKAEEKIESRKKS